MDTDNITDKSDPAATSSLEAPGKEMADPMDTSIDAASLHGLGDGRVSLQNQISDPDNQMIASSSPSPTTEGLPPLSATTPPGGHIGGVPLTPPTGGLMASMSPFANPMLGSPHGLGHPQQKRGPGRPRKDGQSPIPRKQKM